MSNHQEHRVMTFDRDPYVPMKQAVENLAAACDGAITHDDRGFDGADTRAGHLYAFLPLEAWPLCAFHRVWRWMKKYHRQLEGIDCSAIAEPPLFEGEDRQIALDPDGYYHVVFPNRDWELIEAFRALPGSTSHKRIISENLFFRYRTYHGTVSALLAFAERNRFQLGPGVRDHASYRVVYEVQSDSFALYFPDRSLNDEVRTIPYRTSSFMGGFHWIIEARWDAAGPLRAFLNRHDFAVPPDAQQRLLEIEREGSRAELPREVR